MTHSWEDSYSSSPLQCHILQPSGRLELESVEDQCLQPQNWGEDISFCQNHTVSDIGVVVQLHTISSYFEIATKVLFEDSHTHTMHLRSGRKKGKIYIPVVNTCLEEHNEMEAEIGMYLEICNKMKLHFLVSFPEGFLMYRLHFPFLHQLPEKNMMTLVELYTCTPWE